MILTIVLSVIALLLAVALGFSVHLNFRLGKNLLAVEEQVEESLDVLEDSYRRITNIAQHELLSDEPFVRELMSSMHQARQAIIMVENRLVVFSLPDSTQRPDDDNDNT